MFNLLERFYTREYSTYPWLYRKDRLFTFWWNSGSGRTRKDMVIDSNLFDLNILSNLIRIDEQQESVVKSNATDGVNMYI